VPTEWRVRITPFAEADLNYLKRHHRNVRQTVRNKVLPSLAKDPMQGEELQGELAAARSLHFWWDRYRLAYTLDPEHEDGPTLVVIGVGLKDGFYDEITERLRHAGEEGSEG
jgi:mRNA-degrading endonuclease RelE of RelBE toxin-antitoxin system